MMTGTRKNVRDKGYRSQAMRAGGEGGGFAEGGVASGPRSQAGGARGQGQGRRGGRSLGDPGAVNLSTMVVAVLGTGGRAAFRRGPVSRGMARPEHALSNQASRRRLQSRGFCFPSLSSVPTPLFLPLTDGCPFTGRGGQPVSRSPGSAQERPLCLPPSELGPLRSFLFHGGEGSGCGFLCPPRLCHQGKVHIFLFVCFFN